MTKLIYSEYFIELKELLFKYTFSNEHIDKIIEEIQQGLPDAGVDQGWN